MKNDYAESIQKQDAYLKDVFAIITDEQINVIVKRIVDEFVNENSLAKEELIYMTQVLEWKSKKAFYDLETHPREILWGLLNKVVKPIKDGYTTISTVAEKVVFLGWLENSTAPVFQADNGKLYRADNDQIRSLSVGAKGKIVYKANARGGSHFFELNNE